MSYSNQSQSNNTVELQYRGILEKVLFSVPITASCCLFLFINATMLFTLRSKSVFRETPRYILLFNLLFADTLLLALSQLLYIMASCRIMLTYPVCGVLTLFTVLNNVISPLTLVVMSLERYVAVCYPLRHANMITIRNTGVAIFVVWAFSSLNVLIRVVLMLDFPFEDLESLQMTDVCSDIAMLHSPMSDHYVKAYTCFVFVSAGVAVTCSYIGVMIAARSASTDKASARKARNTLLLHLVQLGLTLSSTMHASIVVSLSKTLQRLVIARIKSIFYVCIYILPRCLSSLIYGLRDQTIRPVLMYHLCCRLKLSCDSKILSTHYVKIELGKDLRVYLHESKLVKDAQVFLCKYELGKDLQVDLCESELGQDLRVYLHESELGQDKRIFPRESEWGQDLLVYLLTSKWGRPASLPAQAQILPVSFELGQNLQVSLRKSESGKDLQVFLHQSNLGKDMGVYLHKFKLGKDLQVYLHEYKLDQDLRVFLHKSELGQDLEVSLRKSELDKDLQVYLCDSKLGQDLSVYLRESKFGKHL
ncbi:odorant receptor 131-2-like [Symphorus nematophorus]